MNMSKKDVKIATLWSFFILWIYTLGGFNFLGKDNNTRLNHHNKKGQQQQNNGGYVLTVVEDLSSAVAAAAADGPEKQQQTPTVVASFAIQLQLANHHHGDDSSSPQQQEDDGSVILLDHAGPHVISVVDLLSSSTTTKKSGFLKLKKKQETSSSLIPPPIIRLVGEAIIPIPLEMTAISGEWTGHFTVPHLDGTYNLESDWMGNCSSSTTTSTTSSNNMACLTTRDDTVQLHVQGSDKWATSALVPLIQKPTQSPPSWSDSASLFPPEGLWVKGRHVPGFVVESNRQQRYVWAGPQLNQLSFSASSSSTSTTTTTQNDNRWIVANLPLPGQDQQQSRSQLSLASMISTPTQQSWFDSFRDLSNYEIVCWLGGISAQRGLQTFLSLRGTLFPSQRPFKFHYHPMTSLLREPDETWDEELKQKFRKCKHTLIILDDDSFMEYPQQSSQSPPPQVQAENNNINEQPPPSQSSSSQPLSAQEYRTHLVTLLRHVTKALPDPTFPIWMFTIALESPMRARFQTHHCYQTNNNDNSDSNPSPTSSSSLLSLEQQQQHPCNQVIYDIFQHKETLFDDKDQQRIRLLNNTDLSMAIYPTAAVVATTVSTTIATTTATSTEHHPRQVEILATIAIRIYVVVGKQVQEWRSQGQIGKIDGLHRNGTIESHPDEVPYIWK